MAHRTLGLLVALTLALLWAPRISTAQRQATVPRIGYLAGTASSAQQHLLTAFWQEMRELGWGEGENIAFEPRWAEGRVERLPELATALVQRNVHLIIAYGATATRAAQHVTSTIPLVMIVHPDPVAAGLVASFAQPGGNITGVARVSQELSAKRLELLTEAIPGLSHVAVLWQPGSQDRERSLALTHAAAQSRGVQLHPIAVHDPREFEEAFSAIARHHVGGLITVPGTMFGDHRAVIADLAAKHRLPAIFPEKEFVDAGGLMSYGTSLLAQFRRAAYYVDRILKGTKPADLPVEQPMKFELVINLKTAQALGLTIPPTLLFQADEVIR